MTLPSSWKRNFCVLHKEEIDYFMTEQEAESFIKDLIKSIPEEFEKPYPEWTNHIMLLRVVGGISLTKEDENFYFWKIESDTYDRNTLDRSENK